MAGFGGVDGEKRDSSCRADRREFDEAIILPSPSRLSRHGSISFPSCFNVSNFIGSNTVALEIQCGCMD